MQQSSAPLHAQALLARPFICCFMWHDLCSIRARLFLIQFATKYSPDLSLPKLCWTYSQTRVNKMRAGGLGPLRRWQWPTPISTTSDGTISPSSCYPRTALTPAVALLTNNVQSRYPCSGLHRPISLNLLMLLLRAGVWLRQRRYLWLFVGWGGGQWRGCTQDLLGPMRWTSSCWIFEYCREGITVPPFAMIIVYIILALKVILLGLNMQFSKATSMTCQDLPNFKPYLRNGLHRLDADVQRTRPTSFKLFYKRKQSLQLWPELSRCGWFSTTTKTSKWCRKTWISSSNSSGNDWRLQCLVSAAHWRDFLEEKEEKRHGLSCGRWVRGKMKEGHARANWLLARRFELWTAPAVVSRPYRSAPSQRLCRQWPSHCLIIVKSSRPNLAKSKTSVWCIRMRSDGDFISYTCASFFMFPPKSVIFAWTCFVILSWFDLRYWPRNITQVHWYNYPHANISAPFQLHSPVLNWMGNRFILLYILM